MRSILEHRLLSDLNPQQKRAVLETEGPVLVLAGAGSGKTRVLTRRVAYIIGILGVPPFNVLAVTFTNKAAEEMKRRLFDLLGEDIKSLWIGTFHSICVRILRKHAELLGYQRNFSIYDREDQERLLKEILDKEEGISPRKMAGIISAFKNNKYTIESDYEWKIYERYTKELKNRNAMDFDDLLINTIRLFEKFPEVEETYARRFRYIHVDEYQDTNRHQYHILRSLSRVHRNLFVVGDEDQSIYGFRGADIRNILEFEADFKDAKVLKLEENYRSTKTIVKAASTVIAKNSLRKGKVLWTRKERGEKITLFIADDPREEAEFVASMIIKLERNPRDFLILYRTNAQSRALEEALIRRGIPYQVVGTLRFYERKEIKDLVAYLKILVNPRDDLALERVINVPPRGIGRFTIESLKRLKEALNISLMDALYRNDLLEEIRAQTRLALMDFRDFIEKYKRLSEKESAHSVLIKLVNEIDYIEYIKRISATKDEEDMRVENIQEFINLCEEFSLRNEDNKVSDFLAEIATYTEIDSWEDSKNTVSLMTVHNAKGLEFPVVFITGLEENIFPHRSSHEDIYQLEEERRLFHVALTRAKEKVILTLAKERYLWMGNSKPSRFLWEIPRELLELPDEDQNEGLEDEKTPSEEFKVGDRVFHSLFGMGKILSIEDEDKARIMFKTGVKTIILHMAPIRKL